MKRNTTRRRGMLVLVCGMHSCGPARTEPPPRVEAEALTPLSMVGGSGADVGDLVISRIVDASLSASGRYVAVLDANPPYIHLVDRSSARHISFGRKGEGPGELMVPGAIEFVQDTQVVVLSRGRLEFFNLAGDWLRGVSLRDAGVIGMSIAAGCSGRLFVYGVPRTYSTLDTVQWLHAVDVNATSQAEHWLPIAGRAGPDVRYGALIGIDADSLGVWVWHVQGETGIERGYWLPCGDLDHPVVRDSIRVYRRNPQRGRLNGQAGAAFVLPDTLFAGAATDGGVAARGIYWNEDGRDISSFLMSESEQCFVVEIAEHWTVYDAAAGLLLVGMNAEYPSLGVFGWGTVRGHARKVDCKGERGTQPRA